MVNIQLQEDVAAALEERARQAGLSLSDFLTLLAKQSAAQLPGQMTGSQLEELIRAEAARTPQGPSPTGTFSRADIYRDHD